MSRSFLTGLNLNKNELLNARIQNLSTPPSNPVAGQIYFDTDTNQITLWDGTAWVSLAAGGDVGGQITAAIDALTTDDIEEGLTNLYYTTGRAQTDAASLLTGATLTNITITGDGNGLTITAENGVADSDTDDLTEGTTNKYFTDERAQDAVGNAVGTGLSYNDTTGAISVTANTYDAYGAASTVAGDLTTHISDTSTHGVTGNVVGTTDTQTLSNKSLQGTVTFTESGVGSGGVVYASGGGIVVNALSDLQLVSFNGDVILNADGGVYVGTAVAGNDVVTINYLDGYVGDATVDGSTGNTVTDRIATAKSEAQSYADALVQGLNVKDSVRAATAVAGTLATDFDNGSTVGGVTIATNDRILIKNQATASENGIYVVNASGAPTRASDADPVADELNKGAYVLVTEGTYAATGWIVTAYSAGATTWTQFSAANEYTAGSGISISGNAIAVDLDSDSLEITGNGLRAHLNTQGGLDNDSGIFINTGTGLTVNGSNQLTFASGYGVQKYATNNTLLEPTSNVVTWVVNHSIGTRDVTVQLFENSTYTQVEVDVAHTNTTAVTLTWVATANVAADAYRVVVVG